MPVLILTAADSVEQRVKALDLGADDYMASRSRWPSWRRVQALTRRGLGTASNIIKHGPLSFDATGRVAYLNDQMIELSARVSCRCWRCCSNVRGDSSADQLVERLCEWGAKR